MKMKLTDAGLKNYKPRTERDEIFDTEKGGFGVRVTPTSKAFFFIRRVRGQKVRFDLGRFLPKEELARARKNPGTDASRYVSLAEARKKAQEIQIKIDNGVDPRDEIHAHKQATAEAAENTFAAVAKLFLEQYPKAKESPLSEATIRGYRWALNVRAPEPMTQKSNGSAPKKSRSKKLGESPTAKWAARPVREITPQDAGKILDKFEANGHLASARLFKAYVGKFFGWCADPRRKLVPMNPVAGIVLDAKPRKRDRVLPIAEIKAILKAADGLVKVTETKNGKKITGEAQRALIWTLALLGQRREETSLMKWTDLMLEGDKPLWKIPAANTKNGRPHEVELSPEAKEIILKLPRLGDFVFTTDGETAISGFSKIKTALDKGLSDPGVTLEPWRLHDFRRSFSTGCGELGFAPHVVEAALNHISGSKAGVAGVYNHSKYADDCRRMFAAWAKAVTVTEAGSNVVPLRA
ncbi:tyrosine-type recombinase/integrase [Taklimakanibacter deserti]|uniref:tyrosine-type recombinase/integrase n=1 Tax=Taklimakanibacter deserti TaxID=2267839 RepID=UPI000E64B363